MTREEIEIVHNIVKGDAWKLVEKAIRLYIEPLSSIDTIDMSLSGDEMRVEMLARKKAKETVESALRDLNAYGMNEKPTTPLTRSMR